METFISIAIGLGLAAACGFRVFLPLFLISVASRAGFLSLAGSFDWMGSTPALLAFGTATALEIAAYFIPFVDNLLDSVATPAAIVAGALATFTQVGDMNPVLAFSVATVGGVGAAGAVQGLTTVARQLSSLATAGFGNPILAVFEAGGALLMSVLAVFVPFLAVFVVLLCIYFAAKRFLISPVEATPRL
jgi:Domain of unknown function (DUF4126)